MARIQDFCDMEKFEQIIDNWAKSTGLATVAVGTDGKYISKCYNFTEFCIDLTRGSNIGRSRCEKCDKHGKGVYNCHAGLVDFAIPITLEDGTVLGKVIGGQVLPESPDEDTFRKTAKEIGVDPDTYIEALHKVNVRTPKQIEASAKLLGDVVNMFVRSAYAENRNSNILGALLEGINEAANEIDTANEANQRLAKISVNQRMLGINASIEASHAGAAGKGFAIVAGEVQKLAVTMERSSEDITKSLNVVTEVIKELNSLEE